MNVLAGSVVMSAHHVPSEPDELEAALRDRFGLPSFRPWQHEAISEILFGAGRALVIAPTGGGKSLCYQFPAAMLEGTSIVISPLIALMEDQVRALEARGIAATFLASTVDPETRRKRERALAEGHYKLVYIAPERLAYAGTLERLARLRPPLVAIDEAHCIAQWGHDFRPDYLRLGEALETIKPPRILACTATATPTVRAEILSRLNLPEGETKVVLRGFARPNLHLAAYETEGVRSRRKWVLDTLRDALGAPLTPLGGAIVYASTRKSTEDIAEIVASKGWRVAAYHAGLEPEERTRVSDAFAKRALDVVVATNAFGMGIDRADVRCVIHVHPPGSIEAYYQEVGRAGRDGQPAFGILLSGSADMALRRRLIEHGGREGTPVDPAEAKRQWGLFLELMRYVEAGSCRHDFILRHFGDEQETLGGCGHCDVCERLEKEGEGDRKVGEAESILVRKALSGIARAQRRAGLLAIADMLHGVEDERQHRLGLRGLSTFGLLRDHSVQWIISLLRRLVTAGFVEVTTGVYPMPYLTPLGVEVMRGTKPVRVLLPPQERLRSSVKGWRERGHKSDAPEKPILVGDAQACFERLRAVRLELAKEHRVPAYIVCHDRVLVEISERKPRTLAELASVKGMGPARIASYGERFLSAVSD